MKVVIYHAESKNYPFLKRENLYRDLTLALKKNVNSFGFSLIHLTTKGQETWGDENYFYDLDPDQIVYNRELCFLEFLKNTAEDNEVYWFTEPDSRINKIFPVLENDIDFLIRNDKVPISPAWRLAKRTAVPVFEELLSCFNSSEKSWNGDGDAIVDFYKKIGSPLGDSSIIHNGITIGFRNYKLYCMRKSEYTQQFKADHKEELIARYNSI